MGTVLKEEEKEKDEDIPSSLVKISFPPCHTGP
jgi:hypothetical protein